MWIVPLIFSFLFSGSLVESRMRSGKVDVGEPLVLTPLLETGNVAEAQELARVKPAIGNITSYSGYFTVNKACENNLFFWFFPAQKNWRQAPLVLFLQGGPGFTDMYSLFVEVGPLTYKERVGHRKYSWNVENNLLFIDQPVGTGYSFSGKGCFVRNESELGRELYSAVVQFLELFPVLRSNRFFITGYSYAGHYIPVLGYTIHENNPSARVKINLSGMMIGDGYMDAMLQNDLGSLLYQLGLVNMEGRDFYYLKQEEFAQFMKMRQYQKAQDIRSALVDEIYTRYVGNVSILNYLNNTNIIEEGYEGFIQLPQTRKAIHVGNVNFSVQNDQVSDSLGVDPMLSVKPYVEKLLEHYFIVFYNGQLDIICGYPQLLNFLYALRWSGEADYKNAPRHKWCVESSQAGYYKGTHRLYDVLVRNAGHSVAYDQPQWAYNLVNSVTSGPPNNPLHALCVC